MSSSGSTPRPRGKPTDGPVSRYINRRLSTRLTGLLVSLPRPPSPDAVSVAAALLVALGGLVIAMGPMWLGGVLVQAGSILDGVDGEIARALGRQSKAGGLLDTMLDRLADIAVIAGLAEASLAHGTPPWLAVFAAAAGMAGEMIVTYTHCIGEKTLGRHPALVGRLPSIAGRDVRLFLVFLFALAGRPLLCLLAIFGLGVFYSAAKTVEMLAALDTGTGHGQG